MTRKGFAIRTALWSARLLFLLGLGGCVTTIQRPAAFPGAAVQQGLTYGQGVDYVELVRKNIDSRLNTLDTTEAATKAGVGVGVAGAAISGIFRAHVHPILGFMTLGGLSYEINQSLDPKTLSAIYTAAVKNLACIDAAGEDAFESLDPQRAALASHAVAIASLTTQLKADIVSAGRDARYADQIASARSAIAGSDAVVAKLNRAVSGASIAQAMKRSADETVYTTNQQLREKQPSIEAIAQAGALFPAFLNSGANVRSDAATAAANITKQVAAHANDPLNDSFVDLQNRLKDELEAVSRISTTIDVRPIAACQTQFAAAAPMALLNTTPVNLNAGATVVLRTASGGPSVPKWSQDVPADVTWNAQLDSLALTARADAAEKSYRLRVTDFAGHSSDEFTLNVHAKAAAAPAPAAPVPAAAAPGPAAGEKKKPPTPPGH